MNITKTRRGGGGGGEHDNVWKTFRLTSERFTKLFLLRLFLNVWVLVRIFETDNSIDYLSVLWLVWRLCERFLITTCFTLRQVLIVFKTLPLIFSITVMPRVSVWADRKTKALIVFFSSSQLIPFLSVRFISLQKIITWST